METLKQGTRVYYTGDMANWASQGTISAILPASKYSPLQYEITFDESTFEGGKPGHKSVVYAACFNPGPGRRFWPLDEWKADREAKIAQMKKDFEKAFGKKEAN